MTAAWIDFALLVVLAVLLAPLLVLLVLFEGFAFCRRNGLETLQWVFAVPGVLVDIACNYLHFRALGPYPWRGKLWLGRTVTARIATMVNAPVPAGELMTWQRWLAFQLARYLNKRDPGHVRMPATQT